MEEISLNPHLIRWLKDYLSDRHQVVAVEGELSGKLSVVSGVLQGSILGPLLFIMYINTVRVTISSGSEINMFVDDIALYHIITSPIDYAVLQEDVSAISSFIDYKPHNFNEDKCCTMLISRKRSYSLSPPPLYLNATELMQVNSYKYLGVIITNTLVSLGNPIYWQCVRKQESLLE